jgi:glycine cleavage system T protein
MSTKDTEFNFLLQSVKINIYTKHGGNMRKTPLYELHALQGATFDTSSGWLIPKDYGNTLEEYAAVREGIGVFDLSHHGKLRLTGKEHLKFLQGMLTNDVLKLEQGKGIYACLLTAKGKMVTDMKVYRNSDSVLVELEAGLNEKIKELLLRFRLSFKASIEDLTESVALISIQGPKSKKLLELILSEQIPELKEYEFIKRNLDGTEVLIARVNRTGETGFDIFTPSDTAPRVWNLLLDTKKPDLKPRPVGKQALEMLRIEAGIPVYGIDMDENTIPIEAGLWHALSFDKGCYIGQEVIARIRWRGHVNRHLVGFEIEAQNIPKRGDRVIIDEREVGYITSATFSPFLQKPVAIGYIRREFREAGTRTLIKLDSGELIPASVTSLPFFSRNQI